ncbi:MAG TPA: antibiotic biosynthesis monooxygenase [Planctomycetota bacterium]|nr:antibiotic biosynthesis monooxygenase [Planctomycetota bacterium]
METALQSEPRVPVTAIIHRRVRSGRERDFEDWQRGITAQAARFAGCLGITILRPAEGQPLQYTIILQFDHPSSLHRWMESGVRRDRLSRCDPLVETPDAVHERTGLEHWFTLPGRTAPRPAPRYKMWLLSWLSAFALSAALHYPLGVWLRRLPFPLGNLALTFLPTALLTYAVMPRVTRVFWRWPYPQDPALFLESPGATGIIYLEIQRAPRGSRGLLRRRVPMREPASGPNAAPDIPEPVQHRVPLRP